MERVSIKERGRSTMGKKAACLAVIVALAVSVLGCAQKPMELTSQQRTNLTEVAKFGVYNKVYTTYGLEPGITVEDITAHDVSINDYYKLEFTAKGTYAVKADNDEYYTGTFTGKLTVQAQTSAISPLQRTDQRLCLKNPSYRRLKRLRTRQLPQNRPSPRFISRLQNTLTPTPLLWEGS